VKAETKESDQSADKRETILVVDDEQMVLDVVCSILSDSGYNIIKATSPEDVMEIIKTTPEKIDAILSDIVMPGMSGTEMIAQVKDSLPSAEIVFMSGQMNYSLVEPEVLADKVLFIRKPFMPKELLDKMRTALDSKPPTGT
jgi:DNA-binding NtrC family response regulator